ncbi:MAG: carbohydrate kinase family protein, partial [Halobacteria archaeon]|nr:carbohydrate kinase family protein [Halobacteria archaeon]
MEGEDHQPELITVGSAVVDRMYDVTNIPVPDTGAYVLDYDESVGGVEANVAVGVRRLGHTTGVIARVGNDEYADYVVDDLKKNGVDTRRVKRVTGEG